MYARLCTLFFLLTGLAAGQNSGLKVYISADMEGVGGVTTWEVQADPKGREYERFRKLMTQEVNAAIDAAFEAGATDVTVSDSHGDGQNLDVELLDRRAHLVRGYPRPLLFMQGLDGSFAAAMLIGYHASEGRSGAVLAHTMNGGRIAQVKLNGAVVPESVLNAAIAGDFGVPVVLVSGDQAAGEEALRFLGPIQTVAVKRAVSFYSATTIHPQEAQRLIHDGVQQALARRSEMKPYRLSHPVRLEVTLKRTADAEIFSYLPSVERVDGNTIGFTGKDMSEVTRFLCAILVLNPSW